MGARSKRAKILRRANEFDLGRLTQKLMMPRDGRTTIDAWSLEEIFAAREEQMLGQFVRPSRMAEQMRTDDALFTAYQNRLAPRDVIPVEIAPSGNTARGEAIADEAESLFGANGVGVNSAVVQDIHGCLANHGVAFACIDATPREDGSRVDLEMKYWPIEYVRWDPVFRVFKARADPNTVQDGDLHIDDAPFNEYGFVGGFWIPVVHGDGRWIIFKNHELEPFRQDATILPAALIWARHAFAARDWSQGSKAHGSAKIIGELPAGVPLQNAGGQLTPEALAFIELLQSIVQSNSPAGIRPAGSKTDFITNNSTAWQVWSELVLNAEKAAARIYLGTDGVLGPQGDAPGINVSELFGVAKTVVRRDLMAISRGINTGLVQPWCAINFGDSNLAPTRRYCIPNDDDEEIKTNYATRNAAYYEALKTAHEAGLTLTPEYITALAEDYGVRVPSLTAPMAAPPAKALLSLVANTIRHEGDKWCVYSEGGKKLGEYDSKAEAEKRLRQIEYYKNQG